MRITAKYLSKEQRLALQSLYPLLNSHPRPAALFNPTAAGPASEPLQFLNQYSFSINNPSRPFCAGQWIKFYAQVSSGETRSKIKTVVSSRVITIGHVITGFHFVK
jgi:hypothetical protein